MRTQVSRRRPECPPLPECDCVPRGHPPGRACPLGPRLHRHGARAPSQARCKMFETDFACHLATPRCSDAASVQCRRNLFEGRCTGPPRLAHDRQDVAEGSASAAMASSALLRATESLGLPRIIPRVPRQPPRPDAYGLRLARAPSRPVRRTGGGRTGLRHVWPKLGNKERHFVGHDAPDEVNIATKPIRLRHGYAAPDSGYST
jgi:hypothetical protein